MGTRATAAVLSILLLGATGCSLRTSDAADLGPQRETCALGECRICPCPGTVDNGYQVCNSKGEYVQFPKPTPGCVCPPFEMDPPSSCPDDEGAAGSSGE